MFRFYIKFKLDFIFQTKLNIDAGMEKCKSLLLENGQVFLTKSSEARGKIAKAACSWIPSGAVCYTLIKQNLEFPSLFFIFFH